MGSMETIVCGGENDAAYGVQLHQAPFEVNLDCTADESVRTSLRQRHA